VTAAGDGPNGRGPVEIGVDPAAPRPPVGFRLDVPDSFTELDLDPATSDVWIERFLDQRSARVPGAAAQRGRARQVLQSLVSQHRQAGVFLAAFLVAAGPRPGEMVGASLTLAWREFRGGVLLEGLRQYFAEEDPGPGEDLAARSVEVVALPGGEAVRTRSQQRLPVPLTSHRQDTVTVQHLLPVPEPATDWLAVLTMSTPDVSGADEFAALAGRVAASLEFLDATGQLLPPAHRHPVPPQPPPPPGTIGFVPLDGQPPG
jgi:hypothetical protein